MGRAALLGVAVGLVLATIVATSIGLVGGLPWKDASGVGVMVGVWAGSGFGAMVGGIGAIARNERLATARARS